MPQDYRIDLTIGGLVSAQQALRKLADEFKKADFSKQRVPVSGPYSRFQSAQNKMLVASQMNDPLQQADAMFNVRKAHGQLPGVRAAEAANKQRQSDEARAQRLHAKHLRDQEAVQRRAEADARRQQAQKEAIERREQARFNRAAREYKRDQERLQRDQDRAAKQQAKDKAKADKEAAKQAEREKEASLGNQLKKAFGGTRLFTGGGSGGGVGALFPSMGKLQGVFDALPGKTGLVVQAMTALYTAASKAAESLGEIFAAQAATGGAESVNVLRAMGIDPRESASFRQRITSDPYAMRTWQQMGYSQVAPRPFGTTNEADLMLKGIEGLRKIEDPSERLRKARMLGMEQHLWRASVSENVNAGWRRDAATREFITGGPRMSKDTADFEAGKERVGQSLQLLFETLMKPLIKILGPALNALAEVINVVALAFNVILAPVNFLIDGLKMIAEWLDKWIDKMTGKGRDPEQAAKDQHTEAMKEHSRALHSFGGGPRTRGAIPPGMRGILFDKSLEGISTSYGAFALGASGI